MGGNEVTPPQKSYTEIFEEMFPFYLSYGMSYELYWEGAPEWAKSYREAHDLRRRSRNEELWMQGVYVKEALSATVGNMFNKGPKHEYPSEPFPITAAEQQERREREEKARMEQIKARFMARALAANAKIGGSNDKR